MAINDRITFTKLPILRIIIPHGMNGIASVLSFHYERVYHRIHFWRKSMSASTWCKDYDLSNDFLFEFDKVISLQTLLNEPTRSCNDFYAPDCLCSNNIDRFMWKEKSLYRDELYLKIYNWSTSSNAQNMVIHLFKKYYAYILTRIESTIDEGIEEEIDVIWRIGDSTSSNERRSIVSKSRCGCFM